MELKLHMIFTLQNFDTVFINNEFSKKVWVKTRNSVIQAIQLLQPLIMDGTANLDRNETKKFHLICPNTITSRERE